LTESYHDGALETSVVCPYNYIASAALSTAAMGLT